MHFFLEMLVACYVRIFYGEDKNEKEKIQG